jgi:RNA polymerase sigma-70 factor (ECF subfamily)
LPIDEKSRTLVERAAQNDRAALEALLVDHLPGVEAYLRLSMGPMMRAKESAADLVQSLCRSVLADLSAFQYRGEAAFRHWLYTQARHKLVDHHRHLAAAMRHPAREQPLDPHSSAALLDCYGTLCTPSRDLAAQEAVARIERYFDQLPEDHREAIVLHRMVGLSHAEIARKMQRSEGAVRNLLYRGLAQLALALGEGGSERPRGG